MRSGWIETESDRRENSGGSIVRDRPAGGWVFRGDKAARKAPGNRDDRGRAGTAESLKEQWDALRGYGGRKPNGR